MAAGQEERLDEPIDWLNWDAHMMLLWMPQYWSLLKKMQQQPMTGQLTGSWWLQGMKILSDTCNIMQY